MGMGLRLGLGLGSKGPSGPSYGPELITNGNFGTDTTGWTSAGSATLSATGGRIRVTNGAADFGYAHQQVASEIGATYRVIISQFDGTCTSQTRVGTFVPSNEYGGFVDGTQVRDFTLVSTATTLAITLQNTTSTAGHYSEYDTISVRKVL